MWLTKRLYRFLMMEPRGCKHKISGYFTAESEDMVLRIQKLEFFVTNLADCFAVNENSSHRLVGGKTFTRTACVDRKPFITTNYEDISVYVGPKRDSLEISCVRLNVRRFIESLLPRSGKKDEEIPNVRSAILYGGGIKRATQKVSFSNFPRNSDRIERSSLGRLFHR